VGKTIPSLASLNKQFQNHSILKEYCAIVCGNATAELDGKTTIDLNVNGLPAITHVRIDEVVGCNVYGSM
jgi:23S rRNA-/tRNA-specific pseudouridylate synthase